MRIKEIFVKNLFGMFNHIVTMKMNDRITIIHGKNGVGKTALLRIINSLFNLKTYELINIPFDEFRVIFEDDSYIRASKFTKKNNNKQNVILHYKKLNWKKEEDYEIKILNSKNIDMSLRVIDATIPELERISSRTWVNINTKEVYSLEDVIGQFGERLPIDNQLHEQPEWLKTIRESNHIRFIESQRLLNLSYSREARYFEQRPSMMLSVANYADELAKDIKAKLAEYGLLSQSLDRTFPVRVVQQKSATDLTDEKLRKKLNELEEKRSHLISTGLLDKDENPNFQVQEQIDESTKKVLSVYVDDVEKKLSIFESIAERIDIFKRIINQRFSYKQISIKKEKGFVFTSNGNSLSPDKLSSGEQHELVILYELLFKVKPNSLILIDEPELSLHVEWQVQFIKDLQEITKISELDVLLATHSPDLIHDRWDLTVELKGNNE
jgi:predicted ATP-binding protein involved in virulence